MITITITLSVYSLNIRHIEKQTIKNMEFEATHIMGVIDKMLFERLSDIKILASDFVIKSRDSSPDLITKRLLEYRNQYKYYASLSFFNLDRIRVADTAGLHLGKKHDVVRWSIDTIEKNRVSAAADIRIAEELKIPVAYFASPVKDFKGEPLGVVVAGMSVEKIFDIIRTSRHTFGKDVEIDLVNRDGLLLFSNHNRENMYKLKLDSIESYKRSMAGETYGSGRDYHRQPRREYLYVFAREQGYFDFKGNNWTLIFHIPIKVAYRFAADLRSKTIIFMLPVAFFSLIIGLFFARAFSKALVSLRDKSLVIGSGNFDANIEIDRRDELGDLAGAFNEMVNSLKETTVSKKELEKIVEFRTSEIAVINERLSRELKERELIENELRSTNKELKDTHFACLNIMSDLDDLNKTLEKRVENEVEQRRMKEQLLVQQSKMAAMGEMIGAIAHQWKQPLNAIGMIIQDVQDAYEFGEFDKEYLDKSVDDTMEQISFMSNTINDFRDFFKPEKEIAPFEINSAIRDVINLLYAQIKKSNIDILFDCVYDGEKKQLFKTNGIGGICICKPELIVRGFPNEFKQAILNIITNARDAIIKRLHEGLMKDNESGIISIELSANGKSVVLAIRDNGGGISKEISGKIFDPYITSKGKEGTGIGLYMSKLIIEKNMKGRLYAENIDNGAVFIIELQQCDEEPVLI